MRCSDRAKVVGLGTSSIAGLFTAVDALTARETIDAAWSLGVRYFDTAPLYGSGVAERRLGEALADRPRGEYTVSTKVGRVLRPGRPHPHFVGAPALEAVFDYSSAGVHRALRGSLERLQLDRLDIALLHDPEDYLDEARRAIEIAREFANQVGVGTNVPETAVALIQREAIDVVLLAGRYTLLDRSAEEELLPLSVATGVPVIAAGVFNSGVLAGGSTFNYEPAPPSVLRRRDVLDELCRRHDVPLAAAAIQFPLRHPAISTVLVGARTPAEIRENVRLLAHPIPDELWAEVEAASPEAGLRRS